MKWVHRLTRPHNITEDQDTDGDSSEDDFRGFEKVPIVLCERLAITKCCNCYYYKSKLVYCLDCDSKLLMDCKVNLVRDDLQHLLKVHNENRKNLSNHNDTFKCRTCEKVYSSEKKLQNHQENKHIMVKCQPNVGKGKKRVSFSDHVIVHEVQEYHRCRKCPKIYEDYKSLKIHMKKIHKKRKCYICFYCSKDFVDRRFFKLHVRLHCDRCGELLLTKKEYSDHRQNVCKVVKKYQCSTCKEIYFSFMGRKDHSYEHEGLIYVCDICKERFNTKCGVEHHVQFLHTVKRPQTMYNTFQLGAKMLYECNFCEMYSNRQEVLDNHISSLPDLENRKTTSYKDYYFCDTCSQQFSTETGMLQHKWTHFRKKTSQIDDTETSKNKQTYIVGEELPLFLQPKLILHKLPDKAAAPSMNPRKSIEKSKPKKISKPMLSNIDNMSSKKSIVDPYSKKTIFSKHRCDTSHHYDLRKDVDHRK